ncbi:MAG: TRAM domain-containing protein [Candidatus Micrarchaeota archaeon]|nr:TRAM domain-containing protein [Candidatus Micrarchaeota archaeon]
MRMGLYELMEGETYDVKIVARNQRGEGIGRVDNVVVFIRNAKARIGKEYRVRITNSHKTFAYAEPLGESRSLIGNGSLLV